MTEEAGTRVRNRERAMGYDAVWSMVEHSPEARLPGNVPNPAVQGLQRGNELSAGFYAAAAGGRANPAMPVHFRVLFAFLGAFLANSSTYFKLHLHDLWIRAGLAGNHAGCCAADIGAVKIHANAVDQHRHFLFPEAGIRTDITRVSAFDAGGNAVNKSLAVNRRPSGMG